MSIVDNGSRLYEVIIMSRQPSGGATWMHLKIMEEMPSASLSTRWGVNRASGAVNRSPATRMVRPSGRV